MASGVDVAGELRRLAAAYAALLPERALEIERALGGWLVDGNREAAETLQRLAHGLSGAGATYGMFELSALGRELGQQLELAVARETVSGESRATIQRLSLELTDAMRRAHDSVSTLREDTHSGHPPDVWSKRALGRYAPGPSRRAGGDVERRRLPRLHGARLG